MCTLIRLGLTILILFGAQTAPAQDIRALLEKLENLGVWFSEGYPSPEIVRINHQLGVDDRTIIKAIDGDLGRLQGLRILILSNLSIGDGDLEPLGVLAQITNVDVSFTAVGEKTATQLGSWKSLSNINLGHTNATALALRKLADLKLSYLGAASCRIDDQAARVIAEGFPQLVGLDISGTSITNDGLRDVASKLRLNSLDVSNSAITDGAFGLLRMNELEVLKARQLALTADDVDEMGKITHLKELDLSRTKITGGTRLWESSHSFDRVRLTGAAVDDVVIQHVCQSWSISELWLDQTTISSSAVDSLLQLKGVKELHLEHSEILPSAVVRLARDGSARVIFVSASMNLQLPTHLASRVVERP